MAWTEFENSRYLSQGGPIVEPHFYKTPPVANFPKIIGTCTTDPGLYHLCVFERTVAPASNNEHRSRHTQSATHAVQRLEERAKNKVKQDTSGKNF